MAAFLPCATAHAAAEDPLFTFSPAPPPFLPPPTGYLNGPCGLAVDPGGRLYVSDYYHDVVDVFTASFGYATQVSGGGSSGGPCGLALDSSGELYVNYFHQDVIMSGATTPLDSGEATGVAVDPTTNDVYVDDRTHVSEYSAGGALVAQIGAGSLDDGYGIAVSAYSGTNGYVYVPDAAENTVKVYDPTADAEDPVQTITGPPGGFDSLRDAAVAVDRASGMIYVVDAVGSEEAERPLARVDVFAADGTYEGHLKYDVVDGEPTGIAVDNSAGPRYPGGTQGRVYVTSGNASHGGIYAYGPEAATEAAPIPPTIPGAPVGGGSLFASVPIGSAASPLSGIPCDGDACQTLPPEPVDPTLTTRLQGLGDPKPRYKRYGDKASKHHRCPGDKRKRGACRGGRHKSRAGASKVGPTPGLWSAEGPPTSATTTAEAPGSAPVTATTGLPATPSLLAGAGGFDATVWNEGAAATEAGSHPYSIDLEIRLDQGSGESDLRGLRIEMAPGLLLDPAFSSTLCSAAAFTTPRSSSREPSSRSGESCPDRSQVGTVAVSLGAGETRRFGLFELEPVPGAALRLGASPFGRPLTFDAVIASGAAGTFMSLEAEDVPEALGASSLELDLWGTPWGASHDPERGNCLNEAEPGFAWCKSSVGEPSESSPRAFITLPTECSASLGFEASVSSWQEEGEESARAVNRVPSGEAAPIEGCASLEFAPESEGLLSVTKASSSSGYVFRLTDEDPGLADPSQRIHASARSAVVELPPGVTLNPSLGAGLETCTPGQLAAETAFNPPGAGCPNGSKIGDFSVRVPFYEGLLDGGIYLGKPFDNPSDTLLAVYLIAKSADRGLLITVPGKLVSNSGNGNLTATFEDLPQLPYTDLEVDFRSGQRAPLISPPSCGSAKTRIAMTPWAAGGPSEISETGSPITSGIDLGPCPGTATPPFAPTLTAGGVNSNVGSYTPYFVHISRQDAEQEITSYSLVLPKGVTGKLAGTPFCPDAAIEAARHRSGVEETGAPSCPAASEVGRTLTGYGVGPALTYAPGHVYLAGPYHGAPLSLVTIDAATLGPFDLGTIVIRSAFDIDPTTAQLRIDSRASDPIPHILDGIVLHLRDIRVDMDRPQFTHNPSSCEPSQLESTLTGSGASFEDPGDDSAATSSTHFQLLNCLTLGFHPKLGLRLRGGTRRGAYPSLRASFISRGAEDSNLKRLEVAMPHTEFLAQQHIQSICTRPQFEVGRCPPTSIYGRATADTPLFDDPLRGNVYLVSSSHKFPDLVADLHSGSVHIVVEGQIGPSKQGGFRAFFENLPDGPIERFTMTLFGGKRGLLTNSVNICANPPLASVKGLGQNNVGAIFTSRLRGRCRKERQDNRGRHHGGGRKHR
jgi:hypothetical protein